MLTERQQRILSLVVGGLPRVRQADRLGRDRRGRRRRVGAVDGPRRARRARARGLPHPSAHLRRPRADRLRLPLLRRHAAGLRRRAAPASGSIDLSQMRREIEEALRETAVDAVADDRPARRRDRAAALRRPRAPRRGAAAAAEGRDGGRDRLQRRGHQADVQLRLAGRPGPGRVGVELPQRAAQRARPRRADDRRPPRRPRARRRRARVPRRDRATRSPGSRARRRATSTSRAPRGCSPPSTPPTCRAPTR